MIKTVSEFLAKLDDVIWNSADHSSRSISGTVKGHKVKFTLRSELASNTFDIEAMPVQLVANITINGNNASTWGAMCQADNSSLVEFFVSAQAVAVRNEMHREDAQRKLGELVFNSL